MGLDRDFPDAANVLKKENERLQGLLRECATVIEDMIGKNK